MLLDHSAKAALFTRLYRETKDRMKVLPLGNPDRMAYEKRAVSLSRILNKYDVSTTSLSGSADLPSSILA
jgi:hypothetical protein